jgi:hypothetical protein
VIPASLTALTPDFIKNPESIDSVAFERGSQIRQLEKETFGHYTSLESICIAPSVDFIDEHCFVADSLGYWSESALQTVTFELDLTCGRSRSTHLLVVSP